MRCLSQILFGLFVGILIIVLSAGCVGDTNGDVSQLGNSEQSTSPIPSPPPGAKLTLPDPGEIVELLATPRESSYTEDDLFHYGKFFDPLLPNANVGVNGDGAEFTPNWTPGSGVDDLAYCIFSFPALDYDRTSELNYGYTVPPGAYSDVWIGMANWTDNKWDWFAADDTGNLELGSIADYLNGDGTCLVSFVQTGENDATLRWVQLGPPQVDAQIFSFTRSGIAPFSVDFDASASSSVFGLITKYEWDWEGDGIFDADTLGNASTTHIFDLAGEYNPTVRVSTNLGTSSTANMAVFASPSWEHTWGGFTADDSSCIAVDSDGAIYCGGSTDFFTQGKGDALLLKYDFDGNLLWARTWGGIENEAFTGIALAADGSVYVAGYTRSWGEGLDDILLQQWSAEGEVIWSRTWGDATIEKAHSLVIHGDALYIAGESDINAGGTGLSDALVAKFDFSGDPVWVNTFGGDYRDLLKSISVIKPFLGNIEIHVVGTLRENLGSASLLYAHFDDDGTAQTIEDWYGWGGITFGHSIKAIPYPAPTRVWMAGYIESPTGGDFALMLKYEPVEDGVALVYGMEDGTNTRAFAFSDVGGGYLLGGSVQGVGSNDRAFMLQLADTGQTLSCRAYGADTGVTSSFTGLTPFPGSGIIGVGSGSSATESTWMDFDFVTAGPALYPWNDPGFTAVGAFGTSGTPDGTTMYVTTATIDAGGGDGDALIVTSPIT